jgi:hypothetical protein
LATELWPIGQSVATAIHLCANKLANFGHMATKIGTFIVYQNVSASRIALTPGTSVAFAQRYIIFCGHVANSFFYMDNLFFIR